MFQRQVHSTIFPMKDKKGGQPPTNNAAALRENRDGFAGYIYFKGVPFGPGFPLQFLRASLVRDFRCNP